MKIGVPKETAAGERRVALVPDVVRKLTGKGHEVLVEAGAGAGRDDPGRRSTPRPARRSSATPRGLGRRRRRQGRAAAAPRRSAALGRRQRPHRLPRAADEPRRRRALWPPAGATAFAMEAIPRISRAQSMDALSSQSNVAGYRAALIGAELLGRFYPMLMTAAGHDPARPRCSCSAPASPACRRSRPRAGSARGRPGYDVRAAVEEQVQSLGAKFLEVEVGGDAEGEGGYARELTDEEQAAAAAGADRRDRRASTSSSRPRSCPAARRRSWSPPRRSSA